MKATLVVGAVLSLAAGGAQGAEPSSKDDKASSIERGRYIVQTTGCHDCHTPWIVGPAGPEPDMTRALIGHPESDGVPEPASLSGPWIAAVSPTNTAWSGPWGISFTANLTPDAETGLGQWTERMFKDAIRNGRHKGRGRPILPPMPVMVYKNFTDDDLAAIFAYLQSLPPVRNQVPEPVAPPERVADSAP